MPKTALATPASSEASKKVRKEKAKVMPPELPAKASVKTAVRYVPIYVGGLKAEVKNEQIQAEFRTDALVGRFHIKRKIGHAKVLIPEDQVDEALSQKSALGSGIRVAKWNTIVRGWTKERHERRQVYGSHVAMDKTAEAHMETAVYEVRRLLEYLIKPRRK